MQVLNPKSISFGFKLSSRITFSTLMSRWEILWVFMWNSAWANPLSTLLASLSDSFLPVIITLLPYFFLTYSLKEIPDKYSITIFRWLFVSTTSYILRMFLWFMKERIRIYLCTDFFLSTFCSFPFSYTLMATRFWVGLCRASLTDA